MEAVSFLQELIRVNSSNPPGDELKVAHLLAKRCDKIGLDYEMTKLDSNRGNFEIHLKGGGDGELFFCAHMDTVLPGETKWTHPPFSGELVGDKLYGRGASDMKSGLAAMFLAIESLYSQNKKPPIDITFLATAGEEVDSCGARRYLENRDIQKVDAIVIGEPTNEKVVVGHKGALWLEIVAVGKTAHGSMPGQGVNAVEKMFEVARIIESLKLDWKISRDPLGESSIAMTKINGGVQTNVIPDHCSLHIDIRTVPPQDHQELFDELQRRLKGLDGNFEINELLNRPSLLTAGSSDIIQSALKIKGESSSSLHGVSYYTDGAVLNPKSQIPTLIYGPGNEALAHQPDEYVDIQAYLRSIEFYEKLAMQYAT